MAQTRTPRPTDDTTAAINAALDRFKEAHGLTTEGALAAALGVGANTVWRWRAGVSRPRVDAFWRVIEQTSGSGARHASEEQRPSSTPD